MKKVLIISHNPVSTQSNMGKTFVSLFSQFPKDALCQLYIYPTVPNMDKCDAYFRITDKEILNRILKGKSVGTSISPAKIGEEQGMFEDASDESLYRSRKNKSPLRRLLRDAMWRMVRWYTPQLQQWLDAQQPGCIFVAPGVAKFLYNIALKIARERNIPIVTYICDEYYFVKRPKFGLDRLRLSLLQGKIRQLMAHTTHLVVISRELQDAYQGTFGVPTTVLMTGASQNARDAVKNTAAPNSICYFGNIRCNRFVSLGQIGQVLDRINKQRGTDYKLKIYSAEKDEEILEGLRRHKSVELCGFVTGAAYDSAFAQAQLLLHTEAFDEASVDFVKHSVSTKIADSLASGIPLLAYGPAGISSMQHLLRNDCAITATSEEQLQQMLEQGFDDAARRAHVTANGLAVAKTWHDSRRVSLELQSIMEHTV